MSNSLAVHVLFRCTKKSGKIDMTMTGMGSALMQMWALNNTPKSKACMIFERESGKLVFATYGTANGFPKIQKGEGCKDQTCEDFGISLDDLHSFKDDRFDEEA